MPRIAKIIKKSFWTIRIRNPSTLNQPSILNVLYASKNSPRTRSETKNISGSVLAFVLSVADAREKISHEMWHSHNELHIAAKKASACNVKKRNQNSDFKSRSINFYRVNEKNGKFVHELVDVVLFLVDLQTPP